MAARATKAPSTTHIFARDFVRHVEKHKYAALIIDYREEKPHLIDYSGPAIKLQVCVLDSELLRPGTNLSMLLNMLDISERHMLQRLSIYDMVVLVPDEQEAKKTLDQLPKNSKTKVLIEALTTYNLSFNKLHRLPLIMKLGFQGWELAYPSYTKPNPDVNFFESSYITIYSDESNVTPLAAINNDTFSMTSNTTNTVVNTIPQCTTLEPAQTCGSTLARMLGEGLHADCSFLVGGAEVKAHKAVLAARSPVFEAMFSEGRFREAASGVIRIDDFPLATVRSMLKHLYTGEVDEKALGEDAVALLQIAAKYELPELKGQMEQRLAAAVDQHNLCTLALLADMHQCSVLKEVCIDYLGDDTKTVTSTKEWTRMKRENAVFIAGLLEETLIRVASHPFYTGFKRGGKSSMRNNLTFNL